MKGCKRGDREALPIIRQAPRLSPRQRGQPRGPEGRGVQTAVRGSVRRGPEPSGWAVLALGPQAPARGERAPGLLPSVSWALWKSSANICGASEQLLNEPGCEGRKGLGGGGGWGEAGGRHPWESDIDGLACLPRS